MVAQQTLPAGTGNSKHRRSGVTAVTGRTYGDEFEYLVDENHRRANVQYSLPLCPVQRGDGEQRLGQQRVM